MQVNTAETLDSNASNQMGQLLLAADRVAELLDISTRTLWRLRAARKLPSPVKIGGSVRWRAKEIENWIEAGCPIQNKL